MNKYQKYHAEFNSAMDRIRAEIAVKQMSSLPDGKPYLENKFNALELYQLYYERIRHCHFIFDFIIEHQFWWNKYRKTKYNFMRVAYMFLYKIFVESVFFGNKRIPNSMKAIYSPITLCKHPMYLFHGVVITVNYHPLIMQYMVNSVSHETMNYYSLDETWDLLGLNLSGMGVSDDNIHEIEDARNLASLLLFHIGQIVKSGK